MKHQRMDRLAVTLVSTALAAGTMLSSAQAQMNLANAPLFLSDAVQPNIMFTLDDSGSMQWETMPDGITNRFGGNINNDYVMWTFPRQAGLFGARDYNNRRTARFTGNTAAYYRSVENNTNYYDPSVTYEPWIDRETGENNPEFDPAQARNHPTDTGFGTRDLTRDNNEFAHWVNDDGSHSAGDKSFFPAVYYHYEGPDDEQARRDEANYERVEIRSGEGPFEGHGREQRSDCTGGSCSYDQEIQNFSNWYTYHRNRIFAARAGIARAFFPLDDAVRVGFGTINHPVGPLIPFDDEGRTNFIDDLYEEPIDTEGTPLRQAAWDVGREFETNLDVYRDDNGRVLECRRNYHVLMTDGYWNDPNYNELSNQNVTGSEGPEITGPGDRSYQYVPEPPFDSDYSNTLADVAMYFWKRDLQTDLANRVPTTPGNPAFWQHLVTMGVGLGVEGEIPPAAAFDAVEDGDWNYDWPDPLRDGVSSSDPAKIDDLLHASVATRGGFFSAQDAETFSEELGGLLQAVAAEASRSAGGVSSNTTAVQDGAIVYQARFDSATWTGDLLAFDVSDDAEVDEGPKWQASDGIPGHEQRNILTWHDDSGVWISGRGDIPGDLLAHFDGDMDRWDWVRGDLSLDNEPGFRDREGNPLGDIVNSQPVVAGQENFQFNTLPADAGGDTYNAFVDDKDRDVVYVGANDGMLHAFDAENGTELFAYMPAAVFNKLDQLPDPDYLNSHEFFVDGSVTVLDAYNDARSEWATVLVGSTGLGGRGIFALDVTDPTDPDVLWEFSHDELGYTEGRPTIARLNNGEWVAVFGNGYNSDGLDASLFMLDLWDGDISAHVELAAGDEDAPNGLADVFPTDITGDRNTDRLYAGDLHGNMHRIDVSDPDSPGDAVLFQATDEGGTPQPITARPEVSGHPDPGTVMVFFGTGQFLEAGDNRVDADEQVQTFYGVLDDGEVANLNREDNLLGQEFTDTGEQDGFLTRESSQNTFDDSNPEGGWFIDLDAGEPGERVIAAPQLAAGRVTFTTFTPSDDPCVGGGTNWLMEFDALTGSQVDRPIFDLSGDGTMDFDGAGFSLGGGAPMSEGVTLVVDDETGEMVYDVEEDTLTRDLSVDPGVLGRQSWRER
ncbi:PilC/PilY family type IV pilus protein [Aquisalimonas sp.]|uniref:pilus assembly protein n=1 Tax=unclassified Aquisalimonas TaxID=2644645 RepID=UPI0025C2C0D4|nr:PilC/PilY family type IV pilus protein [Aquisalimonas sp.]